MSKKGKLIAIAQYDTQRLHFGKPYSDWLMSIGNLPPDVNKYLTSLDWLHPVAMKVLNSLQCEDKGDLPSEFWNIVNCCHLQPISGEYIDLFNAVYDGIVFLNSNNQTI